jgi:hypothetical protein
MAVPNAFDETRERRIRGLFTPAKIRMQLRILKIQNCLEQSDFDLVQTVEAVAEKCGQHDVQFAHATAAAPAQSCRHNGGTCSSGRLVIRATVRHGAFSAGARRSAS